MSCTYRNSILESDEFMRISYHSLSVIQVPLHALGFYIVIWKTPREMTSVKFSMLALHSACAFWDISWSILTIPVVFFPIVSGLTWFLLECTFLVAQLFYSSKNDITAWYALMLMKGPEK
ncbi:hypothetical protein CAEBREN_16960 [Caenorhabditis brenneri]|uniref:Uncharacterized protein n=1 Tax=Caenorhabditis brenneri TaxID=135651 RepID=G0MU71_CAEBE|nr:hypothetical protein CAEBREN_16960 [Caenorhabditis brenneri]